MKDHLSDVLFLNPFPLKRSDHERQKSGFSFDVINLTTVWIQRSLGFY